MEKLYKENKVLKTTNLALGEFERVFGLKIKHVSTPRQALEQWVEDLVNYPEARGKVLITAFRNHTWVEWAVYCACVIRKMGFEATLLYKGSEIKRLYPEIKYFNFWASINKVPGLDCVDIENLAFEDRDFRKYYQLCEKRAIASLAYNYHVESADIIDNPNLYSKELQDLQTESASNGAKVKKFLESNKFHQFIIYSGIINDTLMLLQGALDNGQEAVCVEGWSWRPGHMIFNFNAPALEYNLRGWMNYFGEWNESKNQEMNQYFKFLDGYEQDSEWLNNFYMVQRAKVGEEIPNSVKEFLQGDKKIYLLACNVIGDSSLLNRETIFRSHREFVEKTIEFFKKRNDLKLIIRVHPGEEWVKSKVKIKMGPLAKQLKGEANNILVIDSYEPLNTFSLIPFTHAGLVWLTSAGVDFVVRGIPVIAAALPKYHGLGIVEEPKSINEYFERIEYYAQNSLRPTKEQVKVAKEYLYLVFKGFSFEAQGRTFRATSCKLGKMPSQEEHDRFYNIILKQIPSPADNV